MNKVRMKNEMLQIEGINFTNQSVLTSSDGFFVGNFVGLIDGLDVGYEE